MAYLWRELSADQRTALLSWRHRHSFPWHSPPHASGARGTYHLTAACLDHAPHIGHSPERMADFCQALISAIAPIATGIHAWCVLPKHYHVLISAPRLRDITWALGKLHGRTSFEWNGEEDTRGRQVWHAAADRFMRSERHHWATIDYIHHNPVRHGYVTGWQDWPYSSVHEFLAGVSRQDARKLWRDYPVDDYGKGWDDAAL